MNSLEKSLKIECKGEKIRGGWHSSLNARTRSVTRSNRIKKLTGGLGTLKKVSTNVPKGYKLKTSKGKQLFLVKTRKKSTKNGYRMGNTRIKSVGL